MRVRLPQGVLLFAKQSRTYLGCSMVDKGEYVPLGSSKVALRVSRLFNESPRHDGTYASVVVKDAYTVVKATCCQYTNLLFSELLREQQTTLALPIVFEKLPVKLLCQAGFEYSVWEVERLYENPRSPDAYLAAYSRTRKQKALSLRKTGFQRQSVEDLRSRLAGIQRDVRSDPSWQASLYVAQAMTAQTQGVLSDTFRFLTKFIEKHQAALDLLTKGNILYDCYNQPVLSDPVSEAYEEEGLTEEVLAHRYVVAARLPVAVRGFDVRIESRCSKMLSEDEAVARARKLTELGIEAVVGTPLCSEIRELMRREKSVEKIWKFKALSEAIRNNELANAMK